jgi:hypothetical protein
MSRENSERRATERTAPRVETTQPEYSPSFSSGQTYEQANWSKLSPAFREAHNRHRQARGLPAIPPPVTDLYVPPKEPPRMRAQSADDIRETQAAAREFLRPTGVAMLPGAEAFYINGIRQKL